MHTQILFCVCTPDRRSVPPRLPHKPSAWLAVAWGMARCESEQEDIQDAEHGEEAVTMRQRTGVIEVRLLDAALGQTIHGERHDGCQQERPPGEQQKGLWSGLFPYSPGCLHDFSSKPFSTIKSSNPAKSTTLRVRRIVHSLPRWRRFGCRSKAVWSLGFPAPRVFRHAEAERYPITVPGY